MRVAVCDDEKKDVELLAHILQENPKIALVQKFCRIEDLISRIQNENEIFDLIFMNISWKNESRDGIDAANEIYRICQYSQIIFVARFDEHYVQKIFLRQVNLCGFMVKPINQSILSQLLNKAEVNIRSADQEKLVIRQRGTVYAIPYRDISYVESSGHQLMIHTSEDVVRIYEKMDQLKNQLTDEFVQCHKSYVVNMHAIKRIENQNLYLRDGEKLTISKAKYAETRKRFFEYIGVYE